MTKEQVVKLFGKVFKPKDDHKLGINYKVVATGYHESRVGNNYIKLKHIENTEYGHIGFEDYCCVDNFWKLFEQVSFAAEIEQLIKALEL